MGDIKKVLLPQGFHDNLPPQAMAEVRLNSMVVNRLTAFGYELVRPALMEFEESLDRDFSSDLFKVTDTLSGKMMVIRNDITPQIARIVKDRYGEQAIGKNIRLAYTGQVIKKTSKGKFTERQLTQAGFELIAEQNANSDAEVLYVAIETYEMLGLKDYTIDLCYPKLTGMLLKEKGYSAKDAEEIIKKLESKDIKELQQDKNLKDIIAIIETADEAADIKTSIAALTKLQKLDLSEKAKEVFAYIKQVLEILGKSVGDVSISLNLLETLGFPYHTGLCYSFISAKTLAEVGRGGRYKISLTKEKSLSAVGFTFLVNSLLKTVDVDIKKEQKTICYDQGFAASKKLRDAGTVTIFE